MKLVSYSSQRANLYLSHKELKIFKKAINEVTKFISIYEYKLRLEASKEEIEKISELINQLIKQSKSDKLIKKEFSFQEINIINNVLNEICNGKKIDNFDTKIGASFEEVDKLSILVCRLGKNMYSSPKYEV